MSQLSSETEISETRDGSGYCGPQATKTHRLGRLGFDSLSVSLLEVRTCESVHATNRYNKPIRGNHVIRVHGAGRAKGTREYIFSSFFRALGLLGWRVSLLAHNDEEHS